MASCLAISLGQHSASGRKSVNQDFFGAIVPDLPALDLKGIAIAIADGISSSPVSHLASQTAVRSFLEDYYCTSSAWSVKASASRVIAAANAWLYSQTRATRGYDPDRGHVTTFSALVLKARFAHLFHVGDSRIARIAKDGIERLTEDHRVVLSSVETYLGRALGLGDHVDIDYRRVALSRGDLFVLTTDGVHDHVAIDEIARTIATGRDLDEVARTIVDAAYERGSRDNLTVQIVRIDELPEDEDEASAGMSALPLPASIPEVGTVFDGWRILRSIHASARSHVFEAQDEASGTRAALKFAAQDKTEDHDHLRQMLMEEWIAKRLAHENLLKAVEISRPRSFAYTTMALTKGETLDTWMARNPRPELQTVRPILEQIAAGLQAMHRNHMVHCDLKPANVMIDEAGHVTLIDFGSTRVAGVESIEGELPFQSRAQIPGALQYSAPEILLGDPITTKADVFALGVTAYQLLTGRLPYGAAMARTRTRRQQQRIAYDDASGDDSLVPLWADAALKRAVHPDPTKRYDEVAELVSDLTVPNPALGWTRRASFAERDPVRFWQAISALLGLVIIALLASGAG